MIFPMISPAQRTCHHCRHRFRPDYRNVYHQGFCSQPECRQASKRSSRRRWLRKPENRNYFREPDNVDRVREWRLAHPGYWRVQPQISELKDSPQTPAGDTDDTSPQSRTLQDLCRSKSAVLAGLISRLSRCALQEDIARCAAQVVSEARCILLRCQTAVSLPAPAAGQVNYRESG